MTFEAAGEFEKGRFRRAALLQLQSMTPEDLAARSKKLCAGVAAFAEWRAAERMLLFSPFRTEPQIAPLEMAALASGRQVFIIPPTLREESELQLPFKPDFILVPGLAFTKDNHRLGRGSGFYDRLLAGRAASAFKLGLCFAFQIHDRIPHEAHDAILDAVITD